jgi:hypothetical protein
MEFIFLYAREGLSRESWSGPPNFHGCDLRILPEAEMQALGGLTLKTFAEPDSTGKGRLFFSLEQDRDSGPGGVTIGLCPLKIHGEEVSGLGAPAVFEDLHGGSCAITDPCVEVPVSIPISQTEPTAIVVLIDTGYGGDVGKATGCAARVQEEGILLPATEGTTFAQVDLQLVTS